MARKKVAKMERITDYILVSGSGHNPESFNETMKAYLDDGYQPWGSPYFRSEECTIWQVVIKREEVDNGRYKISGTEA